VTVTGASALVLFEFETGTSADFVVPHPVAINPTATAPSDKRQARKGDLIPRNIEFKI